MADLKLYNMLGEIIGIADIMGGDFPASAPQSLVVPLITGPGSTFTAPSNTPTGQNGASVLQLGHIATGEIYSKNTEFWSGCPGIISLPSLPTSNTDTDTCQVMYFNRNSQNIGFSYRDTRFNANGMQAGETLIFSPLSNAKIKVDNNGGVTFGTDSSDGQRIYFQINPNGLYFKSPWGNLTFDANGFNVTTASGANFIMAGLNEAGLPIPGITSYVTISAGTFNANCTAVSLGIGPAYAQAVVPVSPVWPPATPLPMFSTIASTSVMISIP